MRERLEDSDLSSANQRLADAIAITPNDRARLQQLDEAKRKWCPSLGRLEG